MQCKEEIFMEIYSIDCLLVHEHCCIFKYSMMNTIDNKFRVCRQNIFPGNVMTESLIAR